MITIRARTWLTAAVLAGATAAMLAVAAAPTAAFADPPARPAPGKPGRSDKDKDKDRPAKPELVSDADAQRFSDFFDKLVTIVVATQDDCVKMAAGVNGHIDANLALINEMGGPSKELPPAVKERIQKKARDELTPAIVKKCSTDKGVEAAFKRMGAGAR